MSRHADAHMRRCTWPLLLIAALVGCSGSAIRSDSTAKAPAAKANSPAAETADHNVAPAAHVAPAGASEAAAPLSPVNPLRDESAVAAAPIVATPPPANKPAPPSAAPSSKTAPRDVPERLPGYTGNKPWNRNPLTPADNPAYRNQGKRMNVLGDTGFGMLFTDRIGADKFVDWPKPKLALVLTGPLQGYIEPCGCAGLENMKGGLARRQSFLDMLSADGWPMLKLDLGELAQRHGQQAVVKYQRTIDGLRTMGYDAIGLAGADLRLPATELISTVQSDSPTQFVSANIGLWGEAADEKNKGYCKSFRILKAGGMTIGVTSVASFGQNMTGMDKPKIADVALLDPEEALAKIVPLLKKERCDKLVLLANMPVKEAIELAKKFPQFNFVVAHDDNDPPPGKLVDVPGTNTKDTKIVELSHKGMWAGVVAFYDDPARPIRYQTVPLDVRFPDAPAMKELMATYQEQLKEDGFEKLGVQSRGLDGKAKFVGSKTCGECHTKAMAVWEKTPHAHATDTLAKLKPPRNFDPECLSCHVTGWDAREYKPFVSGFESLVKTSHLAANGCENCHGPGSEHVAAENGADNALRKTLQKTMRLTLDEARKEGATTRGCARCHDLDNSPDFKFETFWPKVEHHGKD
ncbi:MAG: hypothetical protein K8T25_20425 [Planctomycetia bacterium]|nr:hypothetical protein [Planctomycetia bacterium]